MAEDWIKFHGSLCRGFWRGVPRATRFAMLELALEAKALGGYFDLPFGTNDPIDAIADLLPTTSKMERRSLRQSVRFLIESGTLQVEIGRDGIPTRARFPKFEVYNRITSSAERMRSKRDRDRRAKELRELPNESDAHRDVTCDRLRGEERRGEEKRGELSSSKRAPPVSPKRGTRIAADWRPSPELYDVAADTEGSIRMDFEEVDRILPAFVDYWLAKPGAQGLKLDWEATFRNWLRRERERNPKIPESYPKPKRLVAEESRQDATGQVKLLP